MEVQVGPHLHPGLFNQPCLVLEVVTRELHNRILLRIVTETHFHLAVERLFTIVVTIVENIGI